MASSIERFLIRRTPVIVVDDSLGKNGKFRSRRKRGNEEKSISKKMKRQSSVEILPTVKIESQILWTTKYKPNHIGEMIGCRDKFIEIKRYIEDWISGEENEAILILGPPGIGKTCLVYAIAKELQYKIFEVNCGLANKIVYTTEKLHETIQTHQVCRSDTPKLTSYWSASPDLNERDDLPEISLSSNSIILFDDIDFMISNTVNGFWRALKNLVQESKKPVILTANRYSDFLENFISPLKIFEMEPPQSEEIVKHLSDIVNKESSENADLQLPSTNVTTFNGDVRRTLNEHQYNCKNSSNLSSKPLELTIDDETPSQVKQYNLLCLNDVITAQAGILDSNETRSYFLEGKDIPFDQSLNCRSIADDYMDTIEKLCDKVFGERNQPTRQETLDHKKFTNKLNDTIKKHGNFMSKSTIATEFFPYLSLITTYQNCRRYHTRGSRNAKPPIGPVDPFLIKFSTID